LFFLCSVASKRAEEEEKRGRKRKREGEQRGDVDDYALEVFVAVVFCLCCTISVTTQADVRIDDFAADPNLFFVTNFFKIHDYW
jgi:hypothetical protein